MKAQAIWKVRLERQPHRDAIQRLCTAYRKLLQEQEKVEAKDETDSSVVCAGIDAPAGRGRDDRQPNRSD